MEREIIIPDGMIAIIEDGKIVFTESTVDENVEDIEREAKQELDQKINKVVKEVFDKKKNIEMNVDDKKKRRRKRNKAATLNNRKVRKGEIKDVTKSWTRKFLQTEIKEPVRGTGVIIEKPKWKTYGK